MFAHTRGEEPHTLAALPAGVTDLRLFRVEVSNSGTNNLVFSAGAGITLLWHVVASGDFNRDGTTDLYWQNAVARPANG